MTKANDDALRDLAWCGNSVYHDDVSREFQGRYADDCGACHRMFERLRTAGVVLAPRDEVGHADARAPR